jgi:hypothetical protein
LEKSIRFVGSLADGAAWLKVDSDGQARVILEAPGTELAEVMRLATKTQRLVRVTIEEI